MKVHVLTDRKSPELHVWRDPRHNEKTTLGYKVMPVPEDNGKSLDAGSPFRTFDVKADYHIHEQLHLMIHEGDQWENGVFRRDVRRLKNYRFPKEIWIVEGANRVLLQDPITSRVPPQVTIHLITARKYRNGCIYVWLPGKAGIYLEKKDLDEYGPYFEVNLKDLNQHLFLFKFLSTEQGWEPDYANKVWSSADGEEIWVHSQAAEVSRRAPRKETLTAHFLGRPAPVMRLWQTNSDFDEDVQGVHEEGDWYRFVRSVYTGRPYSFMFHWTADSGRWEHSEAKREVAIEKAQEVWSIEGDHELYSSRPSRNRRLVLKVASGPPTFPEREDLLLDAWVNQDGLPLGAGIPKKTDGTWEIETFPEIVTSFRFRTRERSEQISRHYVKIGDQDPDVTHRYVVLERPDVLAQPPVQPLFQDPPFAIRRPGAWTEGEMLRFAIHCPMAASVHLIGDFTNWQSRPVPMLITLDGAYWWGEMQIEEVLQNIGASSIHGAMYKFLLNGIQPVQDPAADWVESSSPDAASKLVDHARFSWSDRDWRRPGWEYLMIYQLHPSRFSSRVPGVPLERVRKELDPGGYLRTLGITALELLPINEFAGDQSWGYDPAFFYAVEFSYGGPDQLKALVDACHRNGIAVLLDVVFNHAGTTDNILWSVGRESFFKGDSVWGALINFGQPQVIHFFEQNLIAFMKNYHVDGFRFDATWAIRHGGEVSGLVRQPGSDAGWAFMHRLRTAIHSVDPRCIMIAEHLPNEWDLTRYGGPMDSQWNDGFHDRIVDASRGWEVIPAVADSLKVTHTNCNQWYETLNYSESHDEVGNVNDRIANVAGVGQGLRRNKVAGAATLLCRGIPMWFMGQEAGEWRQFLQGGTEAISIDEYLSGSNGQKMRAWWKSLCDLRRGNALLQGPAPIAVHYAEGSCLAFSRGEQGDYFVILNFGWTGHNKKLAELNLPEGIFRERLNSTQDLFQVEGEDFHNNGGSAARLGRNDTVAIPDYGVIVLERI